MGKKKLTNLERHIVICPHCGGKALDHMTECPACKGALKPLGYHGEMDPRIRKRIRMTLWIVFGIIAAAVAIFAFLK
jgi:heterodisulfide reductase subunit B